MLTEKMGLCKLACELKAPAANAQRKSPGWITEETASGLYSVFSKTVISKSV